MTILSDHDIEGQANILFGAVAAQGWIKLLPLRLVSFVNVGLSEKSSDREVWRFAQANGMILLTGNRADEGMIHWRILFARRRPSNRSR